MDEEFDVFNENYNSKIPGYSKKKLANENTPKSKSKGRYFDINEPGIPYKSDIIKGDMKK